MRNVRAGHDAPIELDPGRDQLADRGEAVASKYGVAGFATVGAVAFFAAWSVLSNIFCMLLIATTRPFRLHDQIEVLESGDKPGLKGRVLDINLIYTTLEESGENGAGTLLQIPNSLFFQRITRRWQ